uniref:Signal peptide peptidase SppA n=1 Tax=Rhabditophanes sp. KR3021 TaxID=114890 RepID=A0AC35U962_9BILA
MGGFTASLAATNISYPIALIPILSGTCASVTYSKGILSDAVGWDVLKKELESKEFQENIRGIKNQHWLDELDEYVKKYPEEDKTREFLRIMMREFTFLGNYPQLKDPSLATVIIAESDSYVLQDETPPFAKVWPGSEMVVIPGLFIGKADIKI